MKKLLKLSIVCLLVLCMLFPTACKKNEEDAAETSGDAVATVSTDRELKFEPADFQADMSIYYIDWGLYRDFFFAEDMETVMNTAIYQRTMMVKDYLGVNVIGYKGSAGGLSYAAEIANQVLSGTDTHQTVLTHCYQGLTSLITEGYLTDFYSLEDISLDADYWNSDLMKRIEVHGSAYLGSSDYMIHDPNVIFFNKEIYSQYKLIENPYELVDNGEWTLDKLFQMAAQIDDNIEGDTSVENVYGIVGKADWQVVAFADAAECRWLVDNGGYMELNMGPSNKRYADVFEMIDEASDAPWFGLYGKSSEKELTVDSCKTLFSYESLQQAYKYKADNSETVFGILPYPKYDTDQEKYYSMEWSGFMAVPITVENTEMVGKTLEALAFYSADTTVVAYYEQLLGARLADAPDDAKMLEIVFDGVISNPVFNFSHTSGEVSANENLVYGLTRLLEAKVNNTTEPSLSSLWSTYGKAAQTQLDKYLN